MPERSEPTTLPPRRHREDSPAEPTAPATDPRVLRRIVEALDDRASPGTAADHR